MRRPNSTVVIVAGDAAAEVVTGLDRLGNVRAEATSRRDPEEGSRAARELVARAATPYVVHDLDPLAEVADAWVELFDGGGPIGRLEVAVEAALRALRSGEALLPDYYVVLDPEGMPPTRRHWWLGVLAGVAPSRVVPAPASVSSVRDALAHLSAGRWWPDPPDTWLRGVGSVVPDRVGAPAS